MLLSFSKLLETNVVRPKKKKLLDSRTLFSKNRCMLVAFYFSFYFPVEYILGHFGLFGLTKWLPEVSKIYQHLYLQVLSLKQHKQIVIYQLSLQVSKYTISRVERKTMVTQTYF